MAFQIGLRLQPYSALHPSCRRSARWVTPGPSMQFRLQILLRPRTFSSVSGRDMRSINTATGIPKRFRVDNSSLIIGDELRHFQSMGATFSSPLMERGHAYFDRTRYISVLDEINKPILFFRPRRFGKSMTISMLEHFHGIQFRELHESLYQVRHCIPNQSKVTLTFFDFLGSRRTERYRRRKGDAWTVLRLEA